MSIEKTLLLKSAGLEDTFALARKLASNLKGSETIVLSSDLGGGKTTFTSALARALCSVDEASSPSFTVQNIYELPGNKWLHHYDLYRLNEPGVVGQELQESVADNQVLTVIEWADIVLEEVDSYLLVKIVNLGENSREFGFCAPAPLVYLLEGLE